MWKVDKGTQTGATTSSYSNALSWHVTELSKKTILLKNTHSSFSLKYKLIGYADSAGIGIEMVKETTLKPGEVAEFHYDRQWDKLDLEVINGNGAATYQIDYEGQGA
ncbi:MAG: hypothetical protein PHE50_07465 [Dehalococcoidales bacterium]|nr:hypothetical protein [Dehalococcoidales bacterium]